MTGVRCCSRIGSLPAFSSARSQIRAVRSQETPQFEPALQIPQNHDLIIAGGNRSAAARQKGDRVDRRIVPIQAQALVFAFQVPEDDAVVETGGQDRLAVR